MTNTLGGGKDRPLFHSFDYLLITDVAAASVPWNVAARACKATDDAVVIGSGLLPSSNVSFIKRPTEGQIQQVGLPTPIEIVMNEVKEYVRSVEQMTG